MKRIAQYISFTGTTGCYAELPLAVLAGASTFTIEAKFSTTSTKSTANNWRWSTIAGREIGGHWQDDFGFCVNNGKLCFWAEPKTKNSLTQATGGVFSDAVINDGTVHKVAVVSSNGAIDLYCDGELVAHADNVKAKITNEQTILIASNSDKDSYLQMNLYELRFWNVARSAVEIFDNITGRETGLQGWYLPSEDGLLDYSGNNRHATLYGNPAYVETEVDSLPVAFITDVERKVAAPVQVYFDVQRVLLGQNWRYENAGSADTLITSGTTLTNLPATKSKTGSAFYQTALQKCFDLPATNEIWIKFDVYFSGSNRWRAYNGGENGLTGVTAQTEGRLSFFSNGTNRGGFDGICKKNQLQTVLLHMISGSSSGVVEARIDGTKIYTFTGDVNHGEDFGDIFIQSDGSGTFFSNVIISNVEIKLGEGWHASNSDIERRVTTVAQFVADLERITTKQDIMEFSFDAEVNVLRSLALIADVQHNVQRSLDLNCDIEVFEAIPIEVVDDVARFLRANIILFPIDNSQYFPSQTPALRAPMLRADSAPVVIPSQARPFQANNTQGIQSFELLLEEHQLSAQVKFTSVIQMEPLQAVSGQFLDFAFKMFVENTRQEGILISADCSASIDELLYSQLNYSVEDDASEYLFDFRTNQFSTKSGSNDYSSDSDDETAADAGEEEKYTEIVKKATALTHLQEIVRQLFGGDDSALEPHFTDFVSNLDVEQKDISFSDLISTLFGWSSRIPNKQINIFARVVDGKEKLFVIERGQEPNFIDISGTKHTIPIIEKSVVRTFVGSSPDSSYTMNIQLPGKFLCPPPPDVSPDGKTFYDYKNVSGYGDIKNGYALESSTTYNDDGSKLEVSYIYEEVNGVYSCVKEVARSYDENGDLIDKKTTIHHSLSPSQQFSRMDDEDGNTVGSNVASNLPGFYNEKITLIEPSTNTKTITIPGNPLVDMSFPFIDIEDFERVSQDLIALNRSIQETVTMSIYDYPHLINFTDKIFFNGNEYFLISNSALSSHNIFCQQSIVMRRWFSNVS